MNKTVLRTLDLLIVIAFISLLYIVIKPQYNQGKINENSCKLQSNMFTVKAGVERYVAFNNGNYPCNLEQIYENLEGLEIPVNPYTNEKMTIYDLVQFKYSVPGDVEDDMLDGVNGIQAGEPGQIGVGFFIPIGKDSIPTKYGIIGFDRNGKPLILEEGKKKRVVVLSG